MKLSVFLRGVKTLIDTPKKWAQGHMCQTSLRHTTVMSDPDACVFCSQGAMLFHRNSLRGSHAFPIEAKWLSLYLEAKETMKDFMDGSITEFNDNHTHEEVMHAFTQAIRQAELDEAGIY